MLFLQCVHLSHSQLLARSYEWKHLMSQMNDLGMQ